MIFDLFFISIIVSYCIDISGGWDGITSKISKWLCGLDRPFEFKPFSCSLCLSFWLQVVYICIAGFSLKMLALACLFSYMTNIYPTLVRGMENLIINLINKLNNVK